MKKHDLSVFYFIKNMQKETVLRTTHSNNKAYFYAKVDTQGFSGFVRISKYEYDTINNHWSCVKDSFITYLNKDKVYHEHCLTFKNGR